MTLHDKISSSLNKHNAGSHDQADHGNWAANKSKIEEMLKREREARDQGILSPGFDDDIITAKKRSDFLSKQVMTYAEMLDLSNIKPTITDEGDVKLEDYNLLLVNWTDTQHTFDGRPVPVRQFGVLRTTRFPASYNDDAYEEETELLTTNNWNEAVSFLVTQAVSEQLNQINEAASEMYYENEWNDIDTLANRDIEYPSYPEPDDWEDDLYADGVE